MKETNKSRSAFEDYYNMGPSRSLRLLHKAYCQQTDVKPPTIRLKTLATWSTIHGWQDQIKKRDQEIADAALEQIKERATQTGYAVFQKRIYDLNELAQKLFDLLAIGPLQAGALRAYRGLLADIAAEMGERKQILRIEDWREELRKYDVEPSEIFEEYVKQFMKAQVDDSD